MITGTTRAPKLTDELPGLAVAAGVATLGALIMLGSRNPALLAVAPLGGMGLVFAARRPLLAAIIMVVIEVSNASGVLAPRGIPLFQISMLLGVLAVGFALRDPRARSRLNGWAGICAGLLAIYLATQAVAVIGSVDVAASVAGMRRPVIDCIFVIVLVLLIQMSARPWAVAAAIVIPMAVLSVLTVINEVVYGGTMSFGGFSTLTKASGELVTTLRYGGPTPDSNFWGRHLVMGLGFASALVVRARRSGQRLGVAVWALNLACLLAGTYLTQSRGTFLTAGIAFAVWIICAGPSFRRRSLAYLPLALGLFAVPGVGDRLLLMARDLSEAAVNYNVDPSVLGRLAAQQEAWMMFGERPIFGFGPATFAGEVINFAGRVPVAVRVPVGATHNLYAELAAESGIYGLLGWAVMILGFLTVVALGIVERPDSRERVLAAAAIAAIVAWSFASIALHLSYFRTFGVVLALSAAISPWPVSGMAVRTFLRGVGVWFAAAVLGAAAFWVTLSALSSPAVTATQRMTLMPVGPKGGWYAYALDIRSRASMLPTFATFMTDPQSPVSIEADPVRGVLTFTTTADSADHARDAIQLAAAHADSAFTATIGYQQYSLQAVGSMRIVPAHERAPLATWRAGGVGAGTVLVAGLVLSRIVAKRRAQHQPGRHSRDELASV
ncbi:MAG: O-antigen ligase family protein [Mycolicibacterium sp.]|uniref:O-antigen ligase family protein n=1 Tax=Mycolicibacterium sp. TaxID=2320850 RepID=UPI003D142FCD